MMTFGQQGARLQDVIQGIDRAEAMRRINDAYIHNAERHPWQHYLKRFTLQTEPQYNTGTISVTSGTASVALADGTWVTSWVTAPSSRRMSISGRGEPYDVTVIGTTTSATLADAIIGDDVVDGPYSMYRDVYAMPADCANTRLSAIYDPQQFVDPRYPTDNGRLLYYNQSRFLRELAFNQTLTGIPYCFTILNQTSDAPPRMQIRMYPAPSDARTYHGWYFRRPSLMISEAEYPDWPAEFEDMHWTWAAIDYYEKPAHYSERYLARFTSNYTELFRKMKTEMDGQSAMESDILGTRPRGSGYNPQFFNGSTVGGTVSWE